MPAILPFYMLDLGSGEIQSKEFDVAPDGIRRRSWHQTTCKKLRLSQSDIAGWTQRKRVPGGVIRQHTSFLNLPLEIRLQIYALLLEGPDLLQPLGSVTYRSRFPSCWTPKQRARTDCETPSRRAIFCATAGLGGTEYHSAAALPIRSRSEGAAWEDTRQGAVSITDLMRVCRAVHNDILHVLYACSTISLCGDDLARSFIKFSSPMGLAMVRYVHLEVTVWSNTWWKPEHKDETEGLVRLLRETLGDLRELHVEVALLWGEPDCPQLFWSWLTGDVFGQLRSFSLDSFFLRVSVHNQPSEPNSSEPFKSSIVELLPDCSEYDQLRSRVTGRAMSFRGDEAGTDMYRGRPGKD